MQFNATVTSPKQQQAVWQEIAKRASFKGSPSQTSSNFSTMLGQDLSGQHLVQISSKDLNALIKQAAGSRTSVTPKGFRSSNKSYGQKTMSHNSSKTVSNTASQIHGYKGTIAHLNRTVETLVGMLTGEIPYNREELFSNRG